MIDTKKPRGRGRPRSFDRDEAIDTALNLFWHKGYDGVGVAELSSALGINPPSLYAAFGSKHGLFQEAVEKYVTTEARFLKSAIEGAKNLDQAVTNILLGAAEAFTSCPKKTGCLILDGTRNCTDTNALATTKEMREATRMYLTEAFTRLGAAEAEFLADSILIALTGLSGGARQGLARETLHQTAMKFARGLAA